MGVNRVPKFLIANSGIPLWSNHSGKCYSKVLLCKRGLTTQLQLSANELHLTKVLGVTHLWTMWNKHTKHVIHG